MYLEQPEKPGIFQKILFSDLPSHIARQSTEINFFDYKPTPFKVNHNASHPEPKQDFRDNLARLNLKNSEASMKIELLQRLLKTANVTYLCQDNNSTLMVIIIKRKLFA